ncbi:MAG: hypothetical protein IJX69_05505 [Oscillospiraceae bacterium]|nr:hypothetical protein [Oscillospiraceae bacterium]
MRKICWILSLALLLTGCGGVETFETVDCDYDDQTTLAAPKEIQVVLPEETVLPVMESENGKIYLCRDFEVAVQTLNGGDLNGTIESLCGYNAEDLTVMQTKDGGLDRYEFVWAAAGEDGTHVGRAAVLSDGSYHYCLSVMAAAEVAEDYQEIWNGMFESFTLA